MMDSVCTKARCLVEEGNDFPGLLLVPSCKTSKCYTSCRGKWHTENRDAPKNVSPAALSSHVGGHTQVWEAAQPSSRVAGSHTSWLCRPTWPDLAAEEGLGCKHCSSLGLSKPQSHRSCPPVKQRTQLADGRLSGLFGRSRAMPGALVPEAAG